MMKTKDAMGYTLKQLEKIDERELRQAVSTLRSTSRKRYERLSDTELYSPAMDKLVKRSGGGEIFDPIRGMDRTQLENEYKRYRQFLKSGTSTVGGVKKANKKLREETIKATGGSFESSDEMSQYYSLVDQAINTEVGGVLNYKRNRNADEILHFYSLVDQASETNVGGVLTKLQVKNTVADVMDLPKFKGKSKGSKEKNKRLNKRILKEVEKRLQKIYDDENQPRAVYPSKSIEDD
jgi:hypothetical protein